MIFFIADVLPLGHRGPAPGFNRAAQVLNHIFHEDARASPGTYVDDYILDGPKEIVQPEDARILIFPHDLGMESHKGELEAN